MGAVVVLNIANGVYQNSLYGLASKLPMKYTNAVVLGSNISGTFTSVVNIITIWASPNLRIAAVYYFVSALFVLLVCFDTYLAFPINVSIESIDCLHSNATKLTNYLCFQCRNFSGIMY